MKKIFSLIAAAATAAMMLSCEIVDRDIKPLGNSELSDYAGKLFSNSVQLPVELAEVAIEIDEYLALSEEQKLEDNRFTVRTISDGVYQVSDKNMSCTVDTGCESVWEDGAEWKFLSFISTIYSPLEYTDAAWRTSLTDDVYLTFNAEATGEAKLMVLVEMPGGNALMSLQSRENGNSVWNLAVEGADLGNDGLRAEYGTGYDTGGINVTRNYFDSDSPEDRNQYVARKQFQGMFFVDIYENGTKIDWIEMTFDFNSPTRYSTSR